MEVRKTTRMVRRMRVPRVSRSEKMWTRMMCMVLEGSPEEEEQLMVHLSLARWPTKEEVMGFFFFSHWEVPHGFKGRRGRRGRKGMEGGSVWRSSEAETAVTTAVDAVVVDLGRESDKVPLEKAFLRVAALRGTLPVDASSCRSYR